MFVNQAEEEDSDGISNHYDHMFDADFEGFTFHQAARCGNIKWIFLDSQSTTDIFSNADFLSNIHESGRSMTIHCNAGSRHVTLVGTLRNYGEVWYCKYAITNILSLAKVKERYPVKYDSKQGNQFVVVQPHKKLIFKQSPSGLYYHDTADRAIVMVNTVQKNREGYTQREYDDAKEARRSLSLVGCPSPKDFKNTVRANMIHNCPVTPSRISAAHKIFGPDVASLKGKTTRQTPEPVLTDYVQIPNEILELNKDVTLAVDVMFVDDIHFVVSLSRKIKFTTSEYVPRRSKPLLVKSLNKIINIYNHRCFNVVTALMDREFEPLRDEVPEVRLNITAADEHIPDIERQIRTMKERARAVRSTLPFKRLPARMIIELVHFSTLWINAFPPSIGVSDTYSPRTIMTGTSLDYSKHCKVPLGAYVETHEENSPTNTMSERTRGAI
jgi:hypothetical protein